MIQKALQYLTELRKPWTGLINERQYADRTLVPMYEPAPPRMDLHTLTGFVDYVQANPDGLNLQETVIVVDGPEMVTLESIVFGTFKQRSQILSARLEERKRFQFGQYFDVESFIIALQTYFTPDETTAAILKLVGNLKDEKVKTVTDDGTTQTVTAKTGITKVEDTLVPNPVTLRPYRTFLEVNQPELKCIFRMQPGREGGLPSCALFEADGGLWRIEAIQSIRDYLEAQLSELTMTILA